MNPEKMKNEIDRLVSQSIVIILPEDRENFFKLLESVYEAGYYQNMMSRSDEFSL